MGYKLRFQFHSSNSFAWEEIISSAILMFYKSNLHGALLFNANIWDPGRVNEFKFIINWGVKFSGFNTQIILAGQLDVDVILTLNHLAIVSSIPYN